MLTGKILLETGKEIMKAAAETAKRGKFNRLAMELSRRISKEVGKAKNASDIDFGTKLRESGENPFAGKGEISFPWEKYGFPGAETVEQGVRKGIVENEAIKAERHPAKMPTDVAKRLINEGDCLNEANWANASVPERIAMLEKAYGIMAEEACIPKDMIDQTEVSWSVYENAGTQAGTNVFIGLDKNDNIIMTDTIRLNFNLANLANPEYSFQNAMGTLYHETIHVMQEYSLTEGGSTFTYAELQEEWKADVIDKLKQIEELKRTGNFVEETHVQYLTRPMETWAHMQDQYFLEIWESMEIEEYENAIKELYGVSDRTKPFSSKLIYIPEANKEGAL